MTPEERADERARLLPACPSKAPSWHEQEPVPRGRDGEVERRRRIGLRHDEEYLAELHDQHDRGVGQWSDSWGFLMSASEEDELTRGQMEVDEAARAVHAYLETLPAEQLGVLRVDPVRRAVMVQVTEAADRADVQARAQARAGAGVTVEVETVRYSLAELTRVREAIADLPELEWSGMSVGADGCVEVMVPGDVHAAVRLIATVADPCAFRVTHGRIAPC